MFFFFQAEDGIRVAQESRGLGDVYKRQVEAFLLNPNNGSLRQAIQLEINGNKPEAASSPEVPVEDL